MLQFLLGKDDAWIEERQRLVLNRLLDGFVGNVTTSEYGGWRGAPRIRPCVTSMICWRETSSCGIQEAGSTRYVSQPLVEWQDSRRFE